jgi:hypothetical protein
MERLGLIKNTQRMGAYELEKGYASYKTIVDYFVGDIVLCNNITEIDGNVGYIEENTRYYNENDEEISEEEYYNDDNAYCDNSMPEIYQYYLCNVNDWDKKQAKKAGLRLDYSYKLDCDVLCVGHWGTSWDYVLTNVKLFDNYEDLKKWENEEESGDVK